LRRAARAATLVASLAPLLLAAGCARIQPPPGGPPDRQAPRARFLEPAPGALNLGGRPDFILHFDEYMDRASVRAALSLNPRPEGGLELHWAGRRLRVRPARPLPPDRSWTLELGTGARDLADNPLAAPLRLPFASGPLLDTLRLRLWVGDRRAAGAAELWLWPLREAPRRRFGQAPWRSSPDERGEVLFQGLPAGDWLALAVEDLNHDGWWDPQRERAGLPSRILSAPDTLAGLPALLRLAELWCDTLSLEGGQFLDRRRVQFAAHLEPRALAAWPDSLRRGPAADSLRLSLLELVDAAGRRPPLVGLARDGEGWRLLLAQPADSLPHLLRLADGSDSLRLRPPGAPFAGPLVDNARLSQGWSAGRLRVMTALAAERGDGRARQILGGDTLVTALERTAADAWLLAPPRPGGALLLEKDLLRAGAHVWPDTLLKLTVPAAPAATAAGGLQWRWDRLPREEGWRLVVRRGEAARELALGREQTLDGLPAGPATFELYQDRDGSRGWTAGRLPDGRGRWMPAEPWLAMPDTVEILPGWVQGELVLHLPEWIP